VFLALLPPSSLKIAASLSKTVWPRPFSYVLLVLLALAYIEDVWDHLALASTIFLVLSEIGYACFPLSSAVPASALLVRSSAALIGLLYLAWYLYCPRCSVCRSV
jgi:hypothetical protein